MARGQKKEKKELTPEERLQQALVPKKEWPYELPEGWKWVKLGDLTDVIGGGTPATNHSEYYENGTIPWLSPADLSNYSRKYISCGQKNITKEGLYHSSARLLPRGTVCLSSRAPIGYVVIAENELCTNQGFKSFMPCKYIEPEFLYWYLRGNKPMLEAMASGTTFLELSGRKASQILMPLPPVEVQRAISLFINREFSFLDEAKERIQSVLDSAEERKQSILHKTFTGKLIDNEAIFKEIRVGDIVDVFKYGTSEKSTYSNNGIPVLRIPNIGNNGIDFDDLKYLSTDNVSQEAQVREGDILIIRSNGSRSLVGKCAVVPKLAQPYAYASFLIRATVSDEIIPEYLQMFLNSSDARNQMFKKAKSSAGINNINIKEIRSIKMMLPNVENQRLILKTISNLMKKEDECFEIAEKDLLEIDNIKRSILSKAFRGELMQ